MQLMSVNHGLTKHGTSKCHSALDMFYVYYSNTLFFPYDGGVGGGGSVGVESAFFRLRNAV